jgi:hypothetical protein
MKTTALALKFASVTLGFAIVVAGLAWNAVAFTMAAHYGVVDYFRAHPPGANFSLVAAGALLILAGSQIPRVPSK